MKFISIRDFRAGSSSLWEVNSPQEDYILTNHGKPTAMLVPINENDFEETVAAMRQARALQALDSLRASAKANGLDKLSMPDINRIIQKTRKKRKKGA